jgi:hypothetical protein
MMALLAGALCACGSEDGGQGGSGRVSFTVWGEEFIENEIPAHEFEDGWSVKFEQFSLSIGNVYVRDESGAEGGEISGLERFDLVEPGPQPLGSLAVAARAWNEVGYAVSEVSVSGTATRGDETRTFAWDFGNTTRYDDCVSDQDGRVVHGIVVPNGGDEVVELTIHGDHFFYDDLASADAVPRFDAIASADSDGDGAVSLEELDAVALVTIPEGTYGTGSASRIDDLGAFVRAQTTTLGHFRGEGHCVASSD